MAMATAAVRLHGKGGSRRLFVQFSLASLIVRFFLVTTEAKVEANSKTVFYEAFDTPYQGRWIVSESSDYKGTWRYTHGKDNALDFGLLASEPAKKYGIAVNLPKIVEFAEAPVVLQYDVRLHNELECGGAYLKFLLPQEAGWNPSQFDNTAPYSIMFGPDLCGETDKVHFIFRHKNPKTGEHVEHHLKSSPIPMGDKISHVYTAVIYPKNNTLQLWIDGVAIFNKLVDLLSGEDFVPSVIPPKTISDPEDRKPEDWDEREEIPDPNATKPEDWDEDAPREIEDEEAEKPVGWLDDEPTEVDNPDVVKPEDWDDEEDGEWDFPKVPNPKCDGKIVPGCGAWVRTTKKNPDYKGKWHAPLLPNPAFMGIWKPRELDNPAWFELEKFHIEPIAAIGIEIWTMQDGILFDNILITHDEAEAALIREKTWKPKFIVETLKKEKAEKAARRGPDLLTSFQDKMFELFYQFAEQEMLAPYKEQILQLLETYAEGNQLATIFGVFAVIAMILALLYHLLALVCSSLVGKRLKRTRPPRPRPRPKDAKSVAKKQDISTPDDPVVIVGGGKCDLSEKADEPIEGTVENAESAGEIEKEEEPNAARRRHRRET